VFRRIILAKNYSAKNHSNEESSGEEFSGEEFSGEEFSGEEFSGEEFFGKESSANFFLTDSSCCLVSKMATEFLKSLILEFFQFLRSVFCNEFLFCQQHHPKSYFFKLPKNRGAIQDGGSKSDLTFHI
jgi:hypothetical protein